MNATNTGVTDLAALTLDRQDARRDAVVRVLKEHGMCVISGWLNGKEIEVLRAEHEKALNAGSAPDEDGAFNAGRINRLKRAKSERDYPAIHRLFSDVFFDEVSRGYIGAPFDLNDEIFVTDHGPDKRQILPLHYDRLWCLKFYVYLKDTTAGDGAFEALPGSHRVARRRREHLLSRGMRAQQLPNRSDADNLESIPIEGKAGTLIVFDTDTLHKGGTVAEGGRRLVLRGHTHLTQPDVYHPVPWTRQWRREHPLNPVTAMRRLADRARGDSRSFSWK
jgi:hypothetical protein